MRELYFLLVFIILSTAFALAALVTSIICAAKSESKEKTTTYECGVKPFSNARIQYSIKYLNYAIIFLIFDVETIFLFPFAIAFNNLELFAVFEIIFFLGLFLLSLIFAIRHGLLRWSDEHNNF